MGEHAPFCFLSFFSFFFFSRVGCMQNVQALEKAENIVYLSSLKTLVFPSRATEKLHK